MPDMTEAEAIVVFVNDLANLIVQAGGTVNTATKAQLTILLSTDLKPVIQSIAQEEIAKYQWP